MRCDACFVRYRYQASDDTVSTLCLLISCCTFQIKLFSFHLYYHPLKFKPPALQDNRPTRRLYSAPDLKTIVDCSNTYHNNSNNNNKRNNKSNDSLSGLARKISNTLHQPDTDALLLCFCFCCC